MVEVSKRSVGPVDEDAHRCRSSCRDARGMVTAELSVAILAALAVLVMLCWGITLVALQLQCVDTAAEVARQSARGDEAAVREAKQDAPDGARVAVRHEGPVTKVRVDLSVKGLLPGLPTVTLSSDAEVLTEPDGAS